jgi:hypothetical protein
MNSIAFHVRLPESTLALHHVMLSGYKGALPLGQLPLPRHELFP